MSSAARSRVFSGYRRLFRARKKLFRDDVEALRESRKAIKVEFVKNRLVEPSGPHFEGLLSMIDEAEDMMIHGIIQGRLDEGSGNYKIKVTRDHVTPSEMQLVEPVTAEAIKKLEKPMVEVTQNKGDDK